MTGSAMRRNIAEHLAIASAADIKAGRYQPTPTQIADVREWLDECAITWLTCTTDAEAIVIEQQAKVEFKPMLTKR